MIRNLNLQNIYLRAIYTQSINFRHHLNHPSNNFLN